MSLGQIYRPNTRTKSMIRTVNAILATNIRLNIGRANFRKHLEFAKHIKC